MLKLRDGDAAVISRRVGFRLLSGLVLIVALSSSVFSQAERKVAHGILIDNTGSLRTQIDLVLKFSKGIVERTHEEGPISLFLFKSDMRKNALLAVVSQGTEWSRDKGILDRYIDRIFVVPGQTALLDGINSTVEQLKARMSLEKVAFDEKILFLITDGEERSSKTNEKELIKTLRASGIKVYAIGLIRELDDNGGGQIRKSTRKKAIAFLEKITKETGGRAVFVKSKKADIGGSLNELFAK